MRYLATSVASFLFVGVGLLSASDDTKDEAIRKDLKNLTGNWTVTTREADGEKSPADALKGVIVEGRRGRDRDHLKDGKIAPQVKWVNMDPTQKMRRLTSRSLRATTGQDLLAIYRVKGDEFTVCVANSGKDRPTEFTTNADNGRSLMTYTRSRDE